MPPKKQTYSDAPIYVSVAWSPDGSILAVGTTTGIWLYTNEFKPIAYFSGEDKDVSNILYPSFLSWSADGLKLLGTGKKAYIWDVKKGRIINSYTPPEQPFGPVSMCPDASVVASTDTSGKLWLWDATTGKDLLTLIERGFGPSVNMVWNKDCSRLIIGTDQGTVNTSIQVWDLHPPKVESMFSGNGTEYSIAVSPDQKMLASGYHYHSWNPETLIIWDIRTGKQLFGLEGHKSVVSAISWSPNGRKLATNDREGNLIIWDIPSHKILAKLQGGLMENFFSFPNALAWSPDGSELVSASTDNIVRVYDMNTYMLITTLTGDGSF